VNEVESVNVFKEARMKKVISMFVGILFAFPAIQAMAIDRDASAIVGLGYSLQNFDGTSGNAFLLNAEIASSSISNAPFGLIIGGDMGTWDSDEEFKELSLGVAWYASKELSLRLIGTFGQNEWSGSMNGSLDGTEMDGNVDAESTSYGLSLSLKYRLIPADNNISPYIAASLGFRQTDAEATGGEITLTAPRGYYWVETGGRSMTVAAQDSVEYDYDPTISFSISPGVDVMLTRNFGVTLDSGIGMSNGGATVTVQDFGIASEDGMKTFWWLGACVKYYFP
jgi:hypothetical protein